MSAAEERALVAVKAAAATGLILATACLPWATARSLADGRTTVYKGGPLSVSLIVLAAVTVALSAVRLIRSSSAIDAGQIVVATASVGFVVALALTKIRHANSLVFHTASQTSYGLGPVAALISAGVILVTSTALLFVSRRRQAQSEAVHADSDSAAAMTGQAALAGDHSPPGPARPHVDDMTDLPPGTVPLPVRWGAIGAASAGVAGGVVGLVIGLRAYPPTAWFAIFELGAPAAAMGALVGLASGAIVSLFSQG